MKRGEKPVPSSDLMGLKCARTYSTEPQPVPITSAVTLSSALATLLNCQQAEKGRKEGEVREEVDCLELNLKGEENVIGRGSNQKKSKNQQRSKRPGKHERELRGKAKR